MTRDRGRRTPPARRRGAPAAGAAGFGRRLLDAYLYGNQVVVTLLAFLVALVVGAMLIAVVRRADAKVVRLLHRLARATPSAMPGRRSPPATRRCSAASIFNTDSLYSNGGVAGPRPDLGHPGQCGAADPRRPGGRPSRSAPGCSTSASRASWSWARSRRATSASRGRCRRDPPGRRAARRHRRRRDLGRHRRFPEGPHRRARGDHDDHAQLRRAVPAGLPARA